SWRASLFLLRPSDVTDPRVAAQSDRYLFDIIKHGGATIGRPGMPAFGAQLSDEDIQLLVGYMRALASRRAARAAHRSRSIQTRLISSPVARTASRTRSPGETRAASSVAGAPRTAIISMAAMPSAVTARWRTSRRSGAARAPASPRTSYAAERPTVPHRHAAQGTGAGTHGTARRQRGP